jgi:ATP-dependent exoDNAse (exonuclease V) beta subunit
VAKRSASAQALPSDSVCPGLHSTEGGNRIVWWDPNQLNLRVLAKEGVRQQKLLAHSAEANQSIEAHARWKARREEQVRQGSRPTVLALPITDLATGRSAEPEPALVEATDIPRGNRPRGPRFGTLVHAVLAHVPLDAERPRVSALCQALARLTGATDDETAASIDAVLAALAHPRLCAARASTQARREVAVTQALGDGTLAEGIIDLAYLADEGWIIIDFKTDATVDPRGVYASQLHRYVEAVKRATGLAASGVLLQV